MYAVFKSGGHQYRAEPGAVIDVERLPVEEGEALELNDVLLVAPDGGEVQIGAPLVSGAKIKATCVSQYRSRKVIVFRYVPKQRYRKKNTHRQHYTRLRIDEIVTG